MDKKRELNNQMKKENPMSKNKLGDPIPSRNQKRENTLK